MIFLIRISSCVEIAAESNKSNNNLRKQQQTATIITTTGGVYFWKSFSRFLLHSLQLVLSLSLSLSDCLSLMEVIPRLLLFVPRVSFRVSFLSFCCTTTATTFIWPAFSCFLFSPFLSFSYTEKLCHFLFLPLLPLKMLLISSLPSH